MTEKRKRSLTDAQVASGYGKTPGSPNAKSLRADHLQAREDRDKAVRLLVECMTDAVPPKLAEEIRTFIREVES